MKNNVGIRTLLKKGLSALVISASTISSMPSRVDAKSPQEISVSTGKDFESLIIENSKYVFDPSLVLPDSASFGSEGLGDGSIGIGGINHVMNFLFAVPGKFRRPAFMANRHFGKRIPNYVDMDWHKFLSTHMTVGAYDGELHLLDQFVKSEEENFSELKDRFGFSEFQKRPTIVFYKNGTEFLQDKLFWPGRGIAGVTKVLGGNEMASYFNGHNEDFAHTNKHEFVHWFDLQRMSHIGKDTVKNMDLWMIEGLAEYYSTGWRAVHEQIMRDLWSNGVFIPIEELNRYQGSFLTYTFGNFYTKFLEETFGPGTALKLRDNAHLGSIDKIIKETTKQDIEEVNRMARDYAHERFKDIENKIDGRKVLTEGFLLASDNGRFLTWGFDEGHIKLYLNRVKQDGKLASSEVVRDADYGSESLMGLFFGDAAGIRNDKVVFSVSDSGRDKLVVKNFLVNDDGFDFNKVVEKSFSDITEIYSPRLVGDGSVVFVGSVDGYHDIFSYDFSADKLSRLTSSKMGIKGLDVNGNSVVFSAEDGEVDPRGLDYNYNLHIMDLKTKETRRLTFDVNDETRPQFSPDGKYVIFQKDVDFVNNLFIHDLKTGVNVRLDREIVGAERPQFIGNDKVLFNTTSLLKPQVRVRELGSLDALVRDALEGETEEDIGAFRVRKNELLLKDTLIGSSDRMKINGNDVKELVLYKDKFYIIGDSDFYELDKSSMVRKNPLPHELRKKQFSKMIARDLAFFEKNSAIYYFGVNDDGTRAVILLNENFFNSKISKEMMVSFVDGQVPVLVYDGPQSLFKKNGPRFYYSNIPQLVDKESLEAEFLVDGNIILKAQSCIINMFPNRSNADVLEKLVEDEGISGKVDKMVVSQDKQLMAFKMLDADMFSGDDHAIVIYNSVDPSPWKVLVNTDDYVVDNIGFIDSNKLFFTAESESSVGFHLYDPKTHNMHEKTFSLIEDGKLSGVVSANGNILFSVTNKDGASELYSGSFGSDHYKKVSEGKKYSGLRSVGGLILYEESDAYGAGRLKILDDSAVVIHPEKIKKVRDSRVVINDEGLLYDIDFSKMSVKKLADESFGFDLNEDKLVFSKAENGLFNVFSYDLSTGEQKALTSNGFNSFRPLFADGAVYYEVEDHGESYIRKIKDGVDERVPLNAPVARLEAVHGELQGRVLQRSYRPLISMPKSYSYNEGVISSERFSLWPIYELQGSALVAYDGRSLLGVIDLYAHNELNTNLSFINLYASPFFKMGSLGFVDLARDFGVKSDLISFGDNVDVGLDFVKSVPLNAHLGIDGSVGMNYQDYPGYKFGTRNNFYPAIGASVSYDDTTFDYLRGPREGTRGFLHLESGYSITDNKLNNYDANFDLRNYIPIIGRFGFDQRVMAGTSQGYNNHFFILGGNMSMRGVPFDGLYGQNYAVGNLDLRLPIFEAVGAAVAGTQYLSPFFTAFDVRAGPYLDGAVVGFNGQKPEFFYSAGYDVNAICFGSVILRYNKGLYGKKDWNFWLGYNP